MTKKTLWKVEWLECSEECSSHHLSLEKADRAVEKIQDHGYPCKLYEVVVSWPSTDQEILDVASEGFEYHNTNWINLN